ncbi:hypothetical protein Tco_0531902 [Tanacetum coccineum]
MEEQMVAPVVDMEGDLAMLFGDDDSSDDSLDDDEVDEEVWEEVHLPLLLRDIALLEPRVPVPLLVIEDLCTRMGNLEYGHGQLVKKVITMSDAEVADGIAIGEIGPRVFAVEGQVQTLQAAVQHRDVQIQQLQALVAEMSSRESTLMQCILGMDRHLADLERRPPGPQ